MLQSSKVQTYRRKTEFNEKMAIQGHSRSRGKKSLMRLEIECYHSLSCQIRVVWSWASYKHCNDSFFRLHGRRRPLPAGGSTYVRTLHTSHRNVLLTYLLLNLVGVVHELLMFLR